MRDFDINFLIHSPTRHSVNYIGGSMVCHSLAHDLATLGESSYICSDSTSPDYSCGIIPWGTDISYDPENTIVVYTAGADHVFDPTSLQNIKDIPNAVRWLVGEQQYSYPSENKFYRYCDHFKNYPDQKVDGQFLSYDVDFNLFKNFNAPRKGSCFFTKGTAIQNRYHPSDSFDLSYMYSIAGEDRMKFLSEVFNTTETFYLYNHRSFIAVLAALCGCNVVVFPHTWEGEEIDISRFNKDEWVSTLPTFRYGIACGMNDLEWSINTKHLVEDNIKSVREQGIVDIKKFVDDCYDWLKNKYNIR